MGVPARYGEEVFKWATQPASKGTLDMLLHPNTGCMYDDHGPRASWVTSRGRWVTKVDRLDFPCNVPGYSCSEPDDPCGCVNSSRRTDAPSDSCSGCHPSSLPGASSNAVLWM